MARIAGVDVPNTKKLFVGLRYIYGIGPTLSEKIIMSTGLDREKRVRDLTQEEVTKLNEYIDANIPVEGQVRQLEFKSIKRLKDIKCYRGLRHKAGLPVRGQNTRSNARTRKGKSKPVGGLIPKLSKK
ncbi:30S ribosomal protein S13 [Candidatus Dojkabacteria bacterium]|uniref:Small ribosomal subunit protein uS13 n=1 Tax=Candidatus Dojkabacteria bacterium TaxID=2099670 RepID=A0A3M0YXH1_9BACT|nr:MAG: 30S ribosomal protein S13 [Candidatus Dojkabacteria bacterium]